MPTTFFMLAGEASGDMHAAKLISALKAKAPDARFVGMGGSAMAAAGMTVAKDLDGMQVVGFWEVAKKYGFFKDVFYKLLDRVKQERPSALICIDYPGFNLRFAKEVRKLGIPVIYYIVPQVWAWKPMRAKSMARYVDRAFCVFEFEPPFFEKFGLKTTFVGHPLVDSESRIEPISSQRDRRTISCLPGSRPGEIELLWPPLRQATSLLNGKAGPTRVLVSLPEHWPERRHDDQKRVFSYDPGTQKLGSEIPTTGSHAAVLPASADFSVVKSGTSTLEAGLAGNPLCVVYKGSPISYAIAHMLVNIPVFSLVNIVLGRYAVPELLQGDVNPARIAAEIERGLTDEKYREQQKAALAELPKKLGGPGASARAAQGILDFLNGRG
jgi:lipid-A-disaccharide synthase